MIGIELVRTHIQTAEVSIIGLYSMMHLFMLMIFISIITSISIDASGSKSSKSRESICNTLPFNTSDPPDVWLNAPDLNVDQLLLVGSNFKARASLSASVASLLSLNTGFDISIDQVNLTIKSKFHVGQTRSDLLSCRLQRQSAICSTPG